MRRTHRGLYITTAISYSNKSSVYVIISTKLVPKAVKRNKIKRWCRDLFSKSRFSETAGTALEIRIKKPEALSYKILKEDIIAAERALLS